MKNTEGKITHISDLRTKMAQMHKNLRALQWLPSLTLTNKSPASVTLSYFTHIIHIFIISNIQCHM